MRYTKSFQAVKGSSFTNLSILLGLVSLVACTPVTNTSDSSLATANGSQASLPSGTSVLMLGDAHMTGLLGSELERSFKQAGASQVDGAGICGAGVERFTKQGETSSLCGTRTFGSKINKQDLTESWGGSTLEHMLNKTKPNIFVVVLGDGEAKGYGRSSGIDAQGIEQSFSGLVDSISKTGFDGECFIVSPTWGESGNGKYYDKTSEKVSSVRDSIRVAVASSGSDACRLVDSLSLMQESEVKTTDGIRLQPASSRAWAQVIFNDVVKAVQAEQQAQQDVNTDASSTQTVTLTTDTGEQIQVANPGDSTPSQTSQAETQGVNTNSTGSGNSMVTVTYVESFFKEVTDQSADLKAQGRFDELCVISEGDRIEASSVSTQLFAGHYKVTLAGDGIEDCGFKEGYFFADHVRIDAVSSANVSSSSAPTSNESPANVQVLNQSSQTQSTSPNTSVNAAVNGTTDVCQPRNTNAFQDAMVIVTRSGTKDEFGLERLVVSYWDGEKVAGKVTVTSGRADTQVFRRASESLADTREPAPEGYYSLGARKPGVGVATGEWFYPIEFDLARTTLSSNPRTDLGFHLDGDRATAPGTVGCLAFPSQSDLSSFTGWLASSSPTEVVIDYGLGSVEHPLSGLPQQCFQ